MTCESLTSAMESLRCGLCMKRFQASGKIKLKELPCQHSLCLGCLNRIADDIRIECPLCKKICLKRIEDLPDNLRLLQLMDSPAISLHEATSPSSSASSSSMVSPVIDCVAMIEKHCRESTKLLPELRRYLQSPKPAEFNAEHLSTILHCLEHHLQNLLQGPDIVILCIQILADDMVKYSKSIPDNIKEQIFKDTLQVVTTGDIPGSVQSSCITIFYKLITSGFKGKYTCNCTKVLFGFLDKPLQMIEEINLLVVLASSTSNLQEAEREEICSRHSVNKLLEVMESSWPVDAYVYIVLESFVNLTKSVTSPCFNVVEEGVLNPLQRMLRVEYFLIAKSVCPESQIDKDHTRIDEVLENAVLLLSNISEVHDLKQHVIKERGLMEAVVTHLQSKNPTVGVISANIITHLTIVEATEWLQLCGAVDIRETSLTKMHKQVRSWIKTDPGTLKFQRDSFLPLFSILQMYNAPPCQLFAAWFLRKSCYDNKETFQSLLVKEGGLPILRGVKKSKSSNAELRKVIKDILRSISSK